MGVITVSCYQQWQGHKHKEKLDSKSKQIKWKQCSVATTPKTVTFLGIFLLWLSSTPVATFICHKSWWNGFATVYSPSLNILIPLKFKILRVILWSSNVIWTFFEHSILNAYENILMVQRDCAGFCLLFAFYIFFISVITRRWSFWAGLAFPAPPMFGMKQSGDMYLGRVVPQFFARSSLSLR